MFSFFFFFWSVEPGGGQPVAGRRLALRSAKKKKKKGGHAGEPSMRTLIFIFKFFIFLQSAYRDWRWMGRSLRVREDGGSGATNKWSSDQEDSLCPRRRLPLPAGGR